MSLKNALNYAKKANEEKMGYRFQFPLSMKEEFELLCNKSSVNMTDMILGLIQSAIDEDKGLYDVPTLNIINKLNVLEESFADLHHLHVNQGEQIITLDNGKDIILEDELTSLKLKINALKRELQKRGDEQ
ncbi:MAG: Unknown protein [uncultured Campylobacterales bacterium]|uniref:Uncharacterized protein n=1 Tax=uncultured Campylobacterales bacterium TaxID=352960 RepID=A0A6S6SIR7_9BACT|nr:MAG: Unknown protein [uncultured Campylobacterales bacterium]